MKTAVLVFILTRDWSSVMCEIFSNRCW